MKLYGWLGLSLLLISEYCLFRKIEPFYSWFYCFAWWSYILLADNLVLSLRGRSLLWNRRPEVWRMLPLSVLVWLIFEAYNLALRNWAYSNVPEPIWIRWPGYFLAFSTVLPGVFITSDLCEHLMFGNRGRPFASESEDLPAPAPTAPSLAFALLGLFFSVAPVVWPRYFFPTVWLGPLFLLDPLLERFGVKSLSLQISGGDRRRLFSLLAGGLACGVMWEFWNNWAASHWVYAVPFFGGWKVFEMPALGFLGFPPFALECWVLYHLFSRIGRRWHSRPLRFACWLAIGLICALMFREIDGKTVLSFVTNLQRSVSVWAFV